MSDVTITRLTAVPSDYLPEYIKLVLSGAVSELLSLSCMPMPIDVLRISNDYYVKRSEMTLLERYHDRDLCSLLSPAELVDCRELDTEIAYYVSHGNRPPTDAKHIYEYSHALSKSDEQCLQSVRRTLAKIRRIINTNCTDSDKLHWFTFTYAENMTDTERLYDDWRKFFQKFARYCKKMSYPVPEYITVIEPQGRGAWHIHGFFIWAINRPYIDNNSCLAPMWGHGFVNIKGISGDCDNIGAYFSAYLSDMSLEEAQKYGVSGEVVTKTITADKNGNAIPEQSKKFVKGARLHFYPPNMRIYRTSRGVKQPFEMELSPTEAEDVRSTAGRKTFESVVMVQTTPPTGDTDQQVTPKKRPQVIRKEFFNQKRK